ncbi:hypothetical protein BH10ACI1_BH10ACI1_27000 [soil metagenome]
MNHQTHKYRFNDFIIEAKAKLSAFILIIFLLVCIFLFFQFLFSNIFEEKHKIFKGKVLDKWFSIGETQQGSTFTRKLLIEGENKERFSVIINNEDYERINLGDNIEKKVDGNIVKLND